jgi:hypothetical protein
MNPDAELQPPFADFMGMKITHVSKDKVVAKMFVRDELNNRFGTLHGGAVMALAAPRPSRARPIFSPEFRSATPPTPNARHCIAAARRWYGRRGSPGAMAGSARW